MANLDSANSGLRAQHSKLFYWLPPILWMAAIFSFSTDTFSGENTGSLLFNVFHTVIPSLTPEQFQPVHFLIRKAAHFTEYGILALLLFRAFRGNSGLRWAWRWAIYAWLILAAYSLSDEFHQSFTHHRTSSIYDSLIDTSGGTVALLLIWLVSRFRQDQLSPDSTRND
jgi:VanZ family protein